MPKTYLSIVGTRPEAIKMAPVIRALARQGDRSVVCVTGQHEHLVPPILKLFEIDPEYRLAPTPQDGQPNGLLARLLPQLDEILKKEQPSHVLVQGDTTSAMAGALAACYAKVPLAHIEAGIRSGSNHEPFPEEAHRRMIDAMADLHFAATAENRWTLLKEGRSARQIHLTGNTGIDAMRYAASLPFNHANSLLKALPMGQRKLILITLHRRESQGEPLGRVCKTLCTLARRYARTAHFVLPVHPNPAVSSTVRKFLSNEDNITLTAPLSYREMIAAAQACYFAMIDSGGLQEELPSLGKPALVLRNVTDRPEAVAAGSAKLVGFSSESILDAFTELMENEHLYESMAQVRDIYGDGRAADHIAYVLSDQIAHVLEKCA
ncbi:non-hydrolyzing UDP-N-acetylglucosamine 2-epimerase [Terriglobus albidus]|uniref:non-hydrolyzing UDP-N-acetylglucosamine 2-epimerase n=1 Tax=Terriglobus albidus TaxID=1592106 RepID=UPI0021DF91AC|nr:UDP-N-acetylglucosamine 2-epimerase (non-hydrolyzing) [Terriglobus albidus]